MKKLSENEEKRAQREGDEMIEHLGDIAFAEIELWPGYRIVDAVNDALKELQVKNKSGFSEEEDRLQPDL